MILQTANGPKEIKVADLDFIRAIIAVLTGTKDLTKAGKILSEHLKYGGSMDEVMEAFTEAMKTAGFGEEAEEPPKSGGKKTKAATE